MQTATTETIDVRLTAIRYAAHETNVFEFERLDRQPLPPATPGAHIDIHLPNGMIRPYSLVSATEGMRSYIIGVKRDAAGRGGSACLHDKVAVGSVLRIGAPRNNFPLVEAAEHTVLIAGGIGITPIWCMAQRLMALDCSFELHYACRDGRDVAFAEILEALPQARLHIDSKQNGKFLDIGEIVRQARPGSHLYCCGPTPMLDSFERATEALDPDSVHLERFGPVQAVARDGGFIVALQDSGQEFEIPEGKSILEVLRNAGLDVAFSCEQGICGACQTKVIEGEPDHRDMVLSDAEKARNETMMICCSGAKSQRLVLAL